MTDKNTRQKLKDIIAHNPASLKSEVAQEALEYDDIPCFFQDLAQGGCISGMIGKLIYYSDTAKFYDSHYDEIEELRTAYEEETGMPLQPKGDLKNWPNYWMPGSPSSKPLSTSLQN